jgi:hypothetical protein
MLREAEGELKSIHLLAWRIAVRHVAVGYRTLLATDEASRVQQLWHRSVRTKTNSRTLLLNGVCTSRLRQLHCSLVCLELARSRDELSGARSSGGWNSGSGTIPCQC